MIYEYVCPEGHVQDVQLSSDERDRYLGEPCLMVRKVGTRSELCREPLRRKFSFSAPPMMHEHYNPTVGKVVSDMKQFRSDLSRASDEATAKTGIPHKYEPVDLQEVKPAEVE